ncbi:MAG: hypothetical protein J6A75_13660 [Lachnospiraceae bacterium]|nr:hypothetical protein [Lachnospiraceae bacterium]
MKEILFKAKRIDNGKWVEGYLYRISESKKHNPFIMVKSSLGTSYEVDVNTNCQYTGLTDKNGNKIWENDIVCFNNNAEKCVVRYRFGAFEFLHRACANAIYAYVGTDLYLDENTLDMEVIGNIIDNPELMKEGQ